jgi:hypothetical protein
LLAVFLFAFTSTSWSYAVTLYQHPLTVLLIASGIYSVWKYKNSPSSYFYPSIVWFNYALAVFIDYPNALLYLPVVIYLFFVAFQYQRTSSEVKIGIRKPVVLAFISFALVTGLHFVHNQHYFGSWRTLSGSLVGYKTIVENNLTDANNEEVQKTLDGLAKNKSNVAKFFSEQNLPNSFGTLMFSRDRGLFLYWPLALLGFLGMTIRMRKTTAETGVLFGIMAVNVFLYSSWGDPWGGWAYGPRYLIPTMAVLSMFAADFIASKGFAWLKKILAFILGLYSIAIALLGVLTSNAVPPRIENNPLGYNFFRNIKLLEEGQSGSFAYKTFFAGDMTLRTYYAIIFLALVALFIFILFVLPKIEKEDAQLQNKD